MYFHPIPKLEHDCKIKFIFGADGSAFVILIARPILFHARLNFTI